MTTGVTEDVGASWDARRVDRVVLVVGDEDLLVARAISGHIAAARAADPQAELKEIQASQLHEGDLAEAASPSMFGELRLLVIRGLQDLGDTMREPLLELLRLDLDDLSVVICHSGGIKGKKTLEAIKALKPQLVTAGKVTKRGELLSFISGEINGAGRRISDDGKLALLDAVGPDLRELSSACAQLVADTSGLIDGETVTHFHRGRAETKGYEVAEAALNGDLAAAFGLLSSGLETGLVPVLVTSSVAGSLRELIAVHAAGGRAVAGMPPWKSQKLARTATRWTETGLRRAVTAVALADAAVKGAGTDPIQALHSMLVEIRRSFGANVREARS